MLPAQHAEVPRMESHEAAGELGCHLCSPETEVQPAGHLQSLSGGVFVGPFGVSCPSEFTRIVKETK